MMMMMKLMIMTPMMMTMMMMMMIIMMVMVFFLLLKDFFVGIQYLKLHYSDQRWFQTSVPRFHGMEKVSLLTLKLVLNLSFHHIYVLFTISKYPLCIAKRPFSLRYIIRPSPKGRPLQECPSVVVVCVLSVVIV